MSYGLAMTILHLFCPALLKELEKNIGSLFNGNSDFNKDIQIMVTNIQEQINQTEFPVFNSDEFRTLLLDMTGTNRDSRYTNGDNLHGQQLIERINDVLKNEKTTSEESKKVDEAFRDVITQKEKKPLDGVQKMNNQNSE